MCHYDFCGYGVVRSIMGSCIILHCQNRLYSVCIAGYNSLVTDDIYMWTGLLRYITYWNKRVKDTGLRRKEQLQRCHFDNFYIYNKISTPR